MARWRAAIFCLIGGFALGALLAGWGWLDRVSLGLGVLWAAAGLALFFIRRREWFFLGLALFCLGVVLAGWRFAVTAGAPIDLAVDCDPGRRRGEFVCRGLVVADPDRRDLTTRLLVALETAGGESAGRVLVTVDNFTDYAYGDRLVFGGHFTPPENFLTEAGRVFDYQNYLATRQVSLVVYYPRVEILARGQGWSVPAFLFKLKNGFLSNLRRALPEPVATLGGGLILGDRGGLGKRVEDNFRRAGLSHLVVLSGYNITIVAENVLRLAAWLWPTGAWLAGLSAVLSFVVMTGAEAAVTRAAIMGGVAILARRWGRPYESAMALVLAGFLMILWQPRLLVFDLGFQLSFLATLGLIYLSPLTGGWLEKLGFKKAFGLREIIATTTAAQLAVYPWLLFKTGNATLVGFVSNLFVLPVIPLAMLASFLTGMAGFVGEGLARLFGYPTYWLLQYVIWVADWFAIIIR